jgi:hypothetical protein
LASDGGSKSGRINPLDGLAFLISAIRPNWPASTLGDVSACRSRAAHRLIGLHRLQVGKRHLAFAAAISSRL